MLAKRTDLLFWIERLGHSLASVNAILLSNVGGDAKGTEGMVEGRMGGMKLGAGVGGRRVEDQASVVLALLTLSELLLAARRRPEEGRGGRRWERRHGASCRGCRGCRGCIRPCRGC